MSAVLSTTKTASTLLKRPISVLVNYHNNTFRNGNNFCFYFVHTWNTVQYHYHDDTRPRLIRSTGITPSVYFQRKQLLPPLMNDYAIRSHFAASNSYSRHVDREKRWRESEERKIWKEMYGPKRKFQHRDGKNSKFEKFPNNMVKIEFCHSILEIQLYHSRNYDDKLDKSQLDHPDLPGTFRSEWDYEQITNIVCDYYGIPDRKHINQIDTNGSTPTNVHKYDNNDDDDDEDDEDDDDTKNKNVQLEYYNYETNDWHIFPKDINSDKKLIQLYKGKGNRTMPLRLVSDYDDGNVSEKDEDVVKIPKEKKPTRDVVEAEAIRLIIRRLIQILHEENYIRVSDTSIGRYVSAATNAENTDDTTTTATTTTNDLPEHDDNFDVNNKNNNDDNDSDNDEMIVIPTKQWIVQRADIDPFLASLLMSRPGALQHIVQCIHWDRVWNAYDPTTNT